MKLIEPGAIQTDFYGRSQEFIEEESITDYDEYVNRCMPNMQQAGANAPGPEIVAEKIYRAATDGSWRMRYVVGRGAPYILLLRRILPTRFFNWMVRFSVERKQDRLRKYQDSE